MSLAAGGGLRVRGAPWGHPWAWPLRPHGDYGDQRYPCHLGAKRTSGSSVPRGLEPEKMQQLSPGHSLAADRLPVLQGSTRRKPFLVFSPLQLRVGSNSTHLLSSSGTRETRYTPKDLPPPPTSSVRMVTPHQHSRHCLPPGGPSSCSAQERQVG